MRIEVLAATATEGGGAARIRVWRTGYDGDGLGVALLIGGTASNVAGEDIVEAPLPTVLTFAEDQDEIFIDVTPVDDAVPEPDETLTVTVLEVRQLYHTAGEASATITIVDDDTLVTNVTVAEAKAIVDGHAGDPDFGVLDVRTPAEFAAGHLAGAVNVDFNAADFVTQLAALDRNRTWLLHCKSGARSTPSVSTLMSLGFRVVDHMVQGYDGWFAAGYPVTTL